MPARSRCVRRLRTRAAALLAVCAGVLAASVPAVAAPCWYPPVQGEVADPFREPACTWCAGNRGIEYRVPAGTSVRAAASGRVVFAGTVVDVRYLVVELASGWRHTYGELASARLETGDVVFANAIVGTASGRFFFGLRIGDDYADPAPFLGVMRTRPRLVPLDGTSPQPAPPATPRCERPPTLPSDQRRVRIRLVGSSPGVVVGRL